LNHFASPEFWFHYRQLPEAIRELADKNFQLLKDNPRHPSIRLKKAGSVWSARVGLHYRALGEDHPDGILWYWIGSHGTYDQIT
jgi:hypothetical protein